jgi:hypothetical protein
MAINDYFFERLIVRGLLMVKIQDGTKEKNIITHPLSSDFTGLVQIILKAAAGETSTLSGIKSETVFAKGILL